MSASVKATLPVQRAPHYTEIGRKLDDDRVEEEFTSESVPRAATTPRRFGVPGALRAPRSRVEGTDGDNRRQE
jgi:hypothetical protein